MTKEKEKLKQKTEEEHKEDAINLAASTLLGDLMTVVVNQVKAIPKSWSELSEHKQDDYLESIKKQLGEAVDEAIKIISSTSFVSLDASVDSVTFKDGVKAILKIEKHSNPAVHDLADAEGQLVRVLILDTKRFQADDSSFPVADKDQSSLALDS